jgi:hypothetical protein
MGIRLRPQGCAPATALAALCSRCAPGCLGEPAQMARTAVIGGLRQHFALPVAGEFHAEMGMGVHGRLLSGRTRPGSSGRLSAGCLAAC